MSYDAPPQVQFSPPPSVPPPRSKQRRRDERPDLNSPAARRHAREAVEIRKLLNRLGVDPERVAPTADGRGHVRLCFEDIRKMARRNHG